MQQRLEEEQATRRAVRALQDLGTDAPSFPERLARLRQEVLAHGEAEERYAFAHLRVTAGRDPVVRGLVRMTRRGSHYSIHRRTVAA
ncbi:hypothetical protein [Streptomyces sp. NPDC051310]|uniref:hypothetical protein n=1 Tax=Streptomyces sp. NPDC051310 TaxID=3365649 RepID=UPI003798F49A